MEGFQKASATCSSFRAAIAERRFGVISDKELARLIAEGTNQNTCKATATWLRTVTAFRNEKKLDIPFTTCSVEELGAFLVYFYSELKPAKGSEYRRSIRMTNAHQCSGKTITVLQTYTS